MDTIGFATKGLDALRREVLGTSNCTACGACVGFCPYVVSVQDRVAGLDGCRKEEGRCYRFCPRSASGVADEADRDGGFAGDVRYAGPLGCVERTVRGRAASPAQAGQHGGVVTSLVTQALRDGLIDAAVLTVSAGGLPETVVATDEALVTAAAGSKFAVAPTVRLVNEVMKLGSRRLGIVALPCQATALRKMSVLGGAEVPTIVFVVGLFCTWALGQAGWLSLLEGALGGAAIRRVDIPPPPAEIMDVELEDGRRLTLPLSDVRAVIRDGCRVCTDMTSENADVSVGLVEGLEGWNTVLVRTPVGAALLDRALASGMVETVPLEVERLAHLSAASLVKKRRALLEAERRHAEGADSPYLEKIAGWKERIDHDCR
jgi:coenzyme F420 hydrogenase subunit beta